MGYELCIISNIHYIFKYQHYYAFCLMFVSLKLQKAIAYLLQLSKLKGLLGCCCKKQKRTAMIYRKYVTYGSLKTFYSYHFEIISFHLICRYDIRFKLTKFQPIFLILIQITFCRWLWLFNVIFKKWCS